MQYQENTTHGISSDQVPSASLFPKAALSVSREEYYKTPLDLNIKVLRTSKVQQHNIAPSSFEFLDSEYWDDYISNEVSNTGPLPDDLTGHVFIIGCAGSFNSKAINKDSNIWFPTASGWQSVLSGDGMIYRLDFHNSTIDKENPPGASDYSSNEIINVQGWVKLSTRLIKTPDYYADCALENNGEYKNWPEYDDSKFKDISITRLSNKLGARNFLNTAWLPMKSRENNSERLLVTWDAGRPYEIDPLSLNLVAPIGFNQEWKPMFDANSLTNFLRKIPFLSKIYPIFNHVFPLIMATAHPVYDHENDCVYGVNATKSLRIIFQIRRSSKQFKLGISKIFEQKEDQTILQKVLLLIIKPIAYVLVTVILSILDFILFILDQSGIGGHDHLYIYRWDASHTSIGNNTWEVVNSDGSAIKISQGTHQMAITKDYIIFSDASFKSSLGDLISSILNPKDFASFSTWLLSPFRFLLCLISCQSASHDKVNAFREIPKFPTRGADPTELLQFIISYFNYPQNTFTDIYVIPKLDFVQSEKKGISQVVSSKKFRISPETAHFIANYDNSGNKITLHVGHIAASDPAEFIHGIDHAVCNYNFETKKIGKCNESINMELQDRAGSITNGLAPNQIGTWVIDLNEDCVSCKLSTEDKNLPFLSYLTFYEDAPDIVNSVFWSCGGTWPFRYTSYMLELYSDTIERNWSDLESVNRSGIRSSILRAFQNVEAQKIDLVINDYYEFPAGFYCSSPQFVPSNKTIEDTQMGYVVCFVVATDYYETECKQNAKFCEFWIFESHALRKGPIFRLSHPKMNIGRTIHTTWLSKLESPPSRKDYSVREDYSSMLDKVEPQSYQDRVRDLFEKEVFPNF